MGKELGVLLIGIHATGISREEGLSTRQLNRGAQCRIIDPVGHGLDFVWHQDSTSMDELRELVHFTDHVGPDQILHPLRGRVALSNLEFDFEHGMGKSGDLVRGDLDVRVAVPPESFFHACISLVDHAQVGVKRHAHCRVVCDLERCAHVLGPHCRDELLRVDGLRHFGYKGQPVLDFLLRVGSFFAHLLNFDLHRKPSVQEERNLLGFNDEALLHRHVPSPRVPMGFPLHEHELWLAGAIPTKADSYGSWRLIKAAVIEFKL
mmetsp:Transcript_266/g.868  ORF Transcript_266/g.868 Transcript_266/m.868 type:complete len:263 (-) Transcript_266:911-1699(-)